MRKTHALVQIAAALDVDSRNWGYDLWRKSGVRSGTMYPILSRMLELGWLADGWEERQPRGRPPRRYYTVTDEGREALAGLLETARQDARFRSLFA